MWAPRYRPPPPASMQEDSRNPTAAVPRASPPPRREALTLGMLAMALDWRGRPHRGRRHVPGGGHGGTR